MQVGIKCYINHSGKYIEINFNMKILFQCFVNGVELIIINVIFITGCMEYKCSIFISLKSSIN